jgi:hypothetical protein
MTCGRTRGSKGAGAWPLALALGLLLPACGSQPPSHTTPAGAAAVGSAGFGWVEVPDPLSGENPVFRTGDVPAPAAGGSVADADFGTTQTRVTETLGVRHEYSRHDPFNADRSLILLQDVSGGDWRVYRTRSIPYDAAANLVRAVDVEEPRWDPSRPSLLWGSRDFRIETLDVETGESTVVKDFSRDPAVAPTLTQNPDLYRITMKDEGESSNDKRYWAFLIQGSADDYRARYIVTWDRHADRVLGLHPIAANQSEIDWVGMSWKGSWVLIGGSENNADPLTGLVIANRELTEFHRVDWATAHADIALDNQGNEVVVMQNVRTDFVDLIPLDLATRPILDSGGSYEGTNRTPLVRLYYSSSSSGLGSGIHVSCNTPGYCAVSTYIAPGLPEQNWLDRKIILVKLDRTHPRAYYLAKVYGTRAEYWEETQASISNDGTRVVFATNWNLSVGAERVWVMEIDLPAGWQAAQPSTRPD